MTDLRRRIAAPLLAALALPAGALAAAGPGAGQHAKMKRPLAPQATTQTTAVTTTVTSTATLSTTATTTTSSTSTTTSTTKAPPPVVPELSGQLGGGTDFPQRTLWLSLTHGGTLTPSTLRVTENGKPVQNLTIAPMLGGGQGGMGIMVVVDQSQSMASGGLQAAMSAVRALAAQRPPGVALGLITYAASPSLLLSPTTSPGAIGRALSASPWISSGSDVLSALSLAYAQLSKARVSVGAVVLISDSTQLPAGTGPDVATDGGLEAGIQTYALELKDGPGAAPSLRGLDATSVKAVAPGQLAAAVSGVLSTLTSGYLVRYRSPAAPGTDVNLDVHVNGVPRDLHMAYPAPAAAPAPRRDKSRAPAGPTVPAPDPNSAPQPLRNVPVLVAPEPAAPAHKATFWDSAFSVPLIGGLAALLLAIGLMLAFGRSSERRALRARVASAIGEAEGPDTAETLSGERERGPRLLAGASWWPRFVGAVETARFQRSPGSVVKVAPAGSFVIGGLFTVLMGSVAGLFLGLPFGPLGLFVALRRGGRKQRTKFADQLPSHLHDLSGAMRAGRSFVGAIATVAANADEPIRGELERAMADEQLGKPLEETLEAIALRMESTDMEQVAMIASLHRRTGSNVAEALDRVAEGARERADLRRELQALTAQSKLSSRVLTALPVGLVLAMVAIAPRYAYPMIHTLGGWVVLVFSGILIIAGWFVMKKITNVEA